ncbi:MAG: hypothetical protein C0601_10445 [Candidatus Muiribacterium halophilum]|uniref:Sulfotransferase domain-containing protein n=1 Tax=Muiribacterium halophilum TaxID=2053465 RepID=A0A2N5ZCK8_MUIH1|nr:MAG: hypothetical protein C0601_10445 [Candidatus Muirbacterium halophilum]
MKKPFFIGIGTPRSGSTTISELLKKSKDVDVPYMKELHFFSNSYIFKKGKDWYESHFDSNPKLCSGEFTPSYFFHEKVPKRIYDYYHDDIKFIVCLRNPVKRAFSYYNHNFNRGLEKRSFNKAIKDEIEGKEKKINKRYIFQSLYSKHINRFFSYFNRKNFLFLIFEEDIVGEQKDLKMKLSSFLNILLEDDLKPIKRNQTSSSRFLFINKFIHEYNPIKKIGGFFLPSLKLRRKVMFFLSNLNRSNKKKEKKELDINTYNKLMELYFFDDISKTEKLISKDLSLWK